MVNLHRFTDLNQVHLTIYEPDATLFDYLSNLMQLYLKISIQDYVDFWFQKTDADTALIQAVDEPSNPPQIGGACHTCGRGGVSQMNDIDGDGIPNYLDSDSDNDGILDSEENL